MGAKRFGVRFRWISKSGAITVKDKVFETEAKMIAWLDKNEDSIVEILAYTDEY